MFDGDELHCVGASISLDGRFYGNSLCMATAPDGYAGCSLGVT